MTTGEPSLGTSYDVEDEPDIPYTSIRAALDCLDTVAAAGANNDERNRSKFVAAYIRKMQKDNRRLRAQLRRASGTEAAIESAAERIYALDPFYESGEYVESFQVSPGGYLTWQQAKARDAEFGDDPRMGKLTEFAYAAARAALSPHAKEESAALSSPPRDGE